jgi:hypothetical protein
VVIHISDPAGDQEWRLEPNSGPRMVHAWGDRVVTVREIDAEETLEIAAPVVYEAGV